MAEHVRAARVDGHAAAFERAAGGDRGIHRVARGGGEHEVGHRLELAPVFVAAGSRLLLDGLRLVAREREHGAAEVREGFEVADGLELAPRYQRREAHRLRPLGAARLRHHVRDRLAHFLKGAPAPVQAGDARLDQRAVL